MRPAIRRRILIALLIACVAGYVVLTFVATAGLDLVRAVLGKAAACSSYGRDYTDWPTLFNGCEGFSVPLAVVELLIVVGLAIAALVQCGRWVLRPLTEITAAVTHFGPTNLRSRINAEGPRDESWALAASIDAMLDRVADGYESQRRFAANASHELRTPLATQRTLIEVSMAAPLSPEQTELLARQLLATNERNERLIEGLLTLAETDQGLVAAQPIRWDTVVGDAVHRFAERTAGLQVDVRLAPVTVTGEQALLDRMVGNLIDNAIKYNVEGGRLDVELTAAGELTVANSGPEVPAQEINRLFEPFQRLSRTRLAHTSGVGLGLTIVRSIVAAHHGTISAGANPGGGLVVRVRLPICH